MRLALAACVTLLLTCYGGAGAALAQDPRGALPVLSQSKALDVATPETLPEGRGVLWDWPYELDPRTVTNFIRLHVVARGLPDDSSWVLLVKDGNGNVYDSLTAASFRWKPAPPGQPAEAARWTQRVPGRKVLVELHAQARPRALRLRIDRLNHSFFRPGTKVITTGSDDMRDLMEAVRDRRHRYYGYGRSIAFVPLQMAGDGTETNCTGFLLAPDLLMTNYHCISEPEQLDTAKAVFGYESQPLREDSVGLTKIEVKDESLDFAVLRLAQPVAGNWTPVKLATAAQVKERQQLVLIQHPSERRKVLSLEDCVIRSEAVTDRPQNPDDFYHLCDCEGGSSGAPVFDEVTGRVVGLHHLGIEGPFKDGVNLAVKIGPIMQKIRSCDESLYNYIQKYTQ
ncbi:MAG TPA: serine protease [Pyrinomonadaceae bacterium]|nr:serine protease [Pyrinomonadaceae bacterium]